VASDPRPLRLPRGVVVAAVVGGALLAVPLVALALAGGAARLDAALTSPAVLTALRLTLATSTIATLLAVATGVPLALVAERGPRRMAVAAGLVGEVPLVVPPVVTGLGLLLTFGRSGLLGAAFDAAQLQITFTSAAVVLAQTSVGLPLVVLAVRSGLSALDPGAEHAAAVHGAGPWRVLGLATLPGLRGAILLGSALAWGRAAGEFGATLTFAGSLPGRTRTLPLQIFSDLQRDPELAAAVALVQVALAIAVLAAARRLRARP
jgi:molybdate transport system permease protein